MKVIKTASGNQIKLSKSEWQSIGKKAGWMKVATEELTIEEIDRRIKNLQSSLSSIIDFNDKNRINSYRSCRDEDEVDSYSREKSLRRQIQNLQDKRRGLQTL